MTKPYPIDCTEWLKTEGEACRKQLEADINEAVLKHFPLRTLPKQGSIEVVDNRERLIRYAAKLAVQGMRDRKVAEAYTSARQDIPYTFQYHYPELVKEAVYGTYRAHKQTEDVPDCNWAINSLNMQFLMFPPGWNDRSKERWDEFWSKIETMPKHREIPTGYYIMDETYYDANKNTEIHLGSDRHEHRDFMTILHRRLAAGEGFKKPHQLYRVIARELNGGIKDD